MDTISDLPEPILHNILKFLPFIEVARTCVLSKRWEQVWRTHPVFIIDSSLVGSLLYSNRIEVSEKRIRALDYLERTLPNRYFNEFVIDFAFCDSNDYVLVNKCLGYAIASNIKSLKVSFEECPLFNYRKYNLPSRVLCSNSIEVLELGYCNVSMPRRTNIGLPSLRKLDMCAVDFEDQVFGGVLVGCPLLEELHLRYCTGLETLELCGHDKLRDIDIVLEDLQLVNVNLMSISSLSIVQYGGDVFEINMTGCKNLRNLKLKGAILKDNRLCKMISELSILECLCLKECDVGGELDISSASLKRFKFYNEEGLLQLLKMDSPNLSHFTYHGEVINLSSNAFALSRINLRFWPLETRESYVKFVEFLAQFHGCSEMLSLMDFDFCDDEVLVGAKELRQKQTSSLFSSRDIRICGLSSLTSIERCMDEFLWIFPHPEALFIDFHGDLWITCQFSYKKPLVHEGGYASCCKSVPILCWEQCIDKVMVRVVFGARSPSCEEQYCLKGAEFLEKIDRLCRLDV